MRSSSNYELHEYAMRKTPTKRDILSSAFWIGFAVRAGEREEKRTRGRINTKTNNTTRRPPMKIFS